MSFWDDILNVVDATELDNPSIDFGAISNVIDFDALEGNTLQRFLGNLNQGQLGAALGSLLTNTTGATGGLNTGLLGLLGGAGVTALGLNDTNIPRVGYTKPIPRYTAVRERMPLDITTERRPGSSGQRYFTDTIYAKNPDAPNRPTLEQAQEEVARQIAPITTMPIDGFAYGGIAQLASGRYLRGGTDGMQDRIKTSIDNKQPAKLSHGEFVIPADVVSHLGNGNSEAGAKQLYAMMDRIRQARTGTKKQGKQINPKKHLPV